MQRLYALLTFLLTVTFSSHAERIQVVTEVSPPSQLIWNGQLSGFAVEFTQQMLKEAGYKSRVNAYNWARTYKTAEEGHNVLIFSIRRTPQREPKFHWIGQVYKQGFSPWRKSITDLKLWAHKDANIQSDSVEDLKHFTLSMPREDYISDVLTNHYKWPKNNLLLTRNWREAFDMLERQRTHLVPIASTDIPTYETQFGLDASNLVPVVSLSMPDDFLYYAFGKNTDETVLNTFKEVYQRLMNSDFYDQQIKKWIKRIEGLNP